MVSVEAAHEQTFYLSADGRVYYSPAFSIDDAVAPGSISTRRLTEMRLEEPLGSRRPSRRPHVVRLSANTYDSAAFHVLALTSDGAVYATGCGEYGALGRGSANSETRFKPVLILGGGKEAPFAVDISAGGRHSAAVTRDGSLYTWGSNQCGQLGFASQAVYVPMKVRLSRKLNISGTTRLIEFTRVIEFFYQRQLHQSLKCSFNFFSLGNSFLT